LWTGEPPQLPALKELGMSADKEASKDN
jgi:hypothetical protein